MAAAPPSPLASSVEKTNGAKLSRLLIDGGTMVLRKIFDRYHPPANLQANLNANYHTLNNLLKRRVLHKPQWDLLFPPGGATPDSNTFDIALLFLLLTNICGLSPPPSGWHTKPLPSDIYVEANLARIKFFRNELYGHVTTTGIDTPTFSALWLEISAVLVALGLPQAEIDRLKVEHCGEEDFIDVLFEWAESEEDIKSQLKDMRQYQAKTGQTVDEVRQTQLENQKTMQDIKAMVEDVRDFQSVAVTQKTIDEKRHTQLGDRETVRDNKVDSKLQEDVEVQREKDRENEILKKLAKIETVKNIRYNVDRYVEGTRLSIFAKIESWLNDRSSPNRVMAISGNAGMGKSVISAVMCEKMQEAGRLAGSHFCQHDRARHRNPKVMLQSLASQLCEFLPEYKKALVEKLSRNLGVEINSMEVKDLFEVLFEEPLTSLNDPGLTYLMVIDGLDESEFQGRNELLDVIANYFQNIPRWIRFLVTTRPENNIAEILKNLHPLQLDPNVEENLKDIHLCFEKQISHLLQSVHRENMLKALVEKSEGVMLYAHYLVDFIKKKVPLVTPELLDSILPSGISSVYHSYFKRLETELSEELNVAEDQFLIFLSSVAAAREPLPLGFVSKLLRGKSASVAQRKVNAAISSISALLPVQDECIHFFHKSVKDWLIAKSNYGQHHFSVDEKEGHQVLSKLCIDELDDVKRKGVTCAKFSDTTRYALRHGVQHMLQLEDATVCSLDEVVKRFVLDVELVYAKLCVNVALAFEDVICVQKQLHIKKWHEALSTLLVLLRKHIATLEKLPHTIFQTLLNEGGPGLSTEALNLLETKYSEIAYVEYLHKEDLQGRAQTKFHCSAAVTCFDVSPQLDYMVCECNDGTIQLWSLHTSKLLWKRHVKVRKGYYFENDDNVFEPYRVTTNYYYGYNEDGPSYRPKSLYRSVVFHPTEDLVLPGILSHAYTFDGNLKVLFPSSKCRFSICSISTDKITMLTDCPENAKSIIMWSLKDGSEIYRLRWSDDIVTFAWSLDGRVLAISDLSGSIGVLDVMEDYRTLAQTTISKGCGSGSSGLRTVCGMIKFSPYRGCLYCLAFDSFMCDVFRLDLNIENDGNFSSDSLHAIVSYHPWEFELCSDAGFLLGDPFWLPSEGDAIQLRRPGLAFGLNEQSVLIVHSRSQVIEMLQLDELTKDSADVSKTSVMKVVLSLNGDTLFVATKTDGSLATLMTWDISSGMFKPGRLAFEDNGCFASGNLVAVREGILLRTRRRSLELWNFELVECIRSWTDLGCIITQVIPISEERVACVGVKKVVIVDTTKEGIVSTTTIKGHFAGCNSKCHVITTDPKELQMQCGGKVLWKMSLPFNSFGWPVYVTFSPSEQYCVLAIHWKFYVLDAVSGEILRTLQRRTHDHWFSETSNCTFVSDEDCVAWFSDGLGGHFLQLFNVKSGDLVSEIAMESRVYSLTACPRKRLIAICLEHSQVNFKVLRLKLPGDKHRRKGKRSGFIDKVESYNTVTSTEPPERF